MPRSAEVTLSCDLLDTLVPLAGVVELVDTQDLGSCPLWGESSSLFSGTRTPCSVAGALRIVRCHTYRRAVSPLGGSGVLVRAVKPETVEGILMGFSWVDRSW